MFQGTVVTEGGKGWWMVEQDGTHLSLFVHHSSIRSQRYLHVGDRVEFNVAPNPKKPGYMQAVEVRHIGRQIARQTNGVEAQS
jgi:cold shock CspA family protein